MPLQDQLTNEFNTNNFVRQFYVHLLKLHFMAKKAKPKQLKRSNVKKTSAKYASSEKEDSHINKVSDVMLDYTPALTEAHKNQRLELRLTKLQKEVISKASSVSGFKNVSDYILHIAITDSKNVIREQQIFELSERDRISFMETLENPPKPGKNLKKAMANYLSFKEGK